MISLKFIYLGFSMLHTAYFLFFSILSNSSEVAKDSVKLSLSSIYLYIYIMYLYPLSTCLPISMYKYSEPDKHGF